MTTLHWTYKTWKRKTNNNRQKHNPLTLKQTWPRTPYYAEKSIVSVWWVTHTATVHWTQVNTYVFLCVHERVSALHGQSVHYESRCHAAQRRKEAWLFSDIKPCVRACVPSRLTFISDQEHIFCIVWPRNKNNKKLLFLSIALANYLPSFALPF